MLRPHAASDLAAYHRLLSDPHGSRFSHRPPVSMAETRLRLEHALSLQSAGNLITWAIAESPGGPMIGYVGLYRMAPAHRRSEVGYLLRSDHWGKGLMTEALERVVKHGFEALGFHRVEAHTHPENRPSIRLLERCGFQFEGVLRQNYLMDGVFWDSAVYGKLTDAAG